jgi:hypothetical protein
VTPDDGASVGVREQRFCARTVEVDELSDRKSEGPL